MQIRVEPKRAVRAPLGLLTGLWLIACGGQSAGASSAPTSAQPASAGAAAPAAPAAGTPPAASLTSVAGAGAAGLAAPVAPAASSGTGVAGRSAPVVTGGAGAQAPAGAAASAAVGGAAAPAAGRGGAGAAAVGGAGAEAGMPVAGAKAALDPKQTVIPHKSWDCGMPEGIPGASGKLVFDAELKLGEIHDIGETQFGHRLQSDITGGSLKGEKISGEVLARGLDYQLVLANGAVEVEQLNIFRTPDGSLIYARTCGTAPAAGGDVRITMDFEAPNASAYAFLNTGKFVGVREFDPAAKSLKIHVFEAGTPDMSNAVQVTEPDGVPDQSWACKVDQGTKGDVIYMESVGIGGGSLSVGASKRGNRNIIPITGGTTTGKIEGTVLEGGADFQIIANGTFHDLDARYSLKTKEGEIIVVRNCGPIGALVPVFEAKKDGKYAWLNENNWLSSDPGLGLGVVNLTIYAKR